MNPRRHFAIPLLAALVLMGAAAAPIKAQSSPTAPPFTAAATPAGWTWWCSEDATACVMLPDGTTGVQKRFLLVTSDVESVSATLSGWVGGGEVVWEGAVETAAGTYSGQIVTNGTIRGLVGTSDQRAFAAIGLEDAWESTAAAYNNALRGGEQQ